MSIKITPTCRYEHGELKKVSGKDRQEKWGYLSAASLASIFSGDLYVCTTCGYTELFDDNVDLTAKSLDDQ